MTKQSIPDLIVKNANVITVDESMPSAEAFAVSNGKFVAIGSNSEIENLVSPNTKIYDAESPSRGLITLEHAILKIFPSVVFKKCL